MQIIRDSEWTFFYNTASKTNTSDVYCTNVANSFWKAKKCVENLNQERIDKQIKFIPIRAQQPQVHTRAPKASIKCKATTMAGKQCGVRATCGEYCKRHKI
jgi:hypothetical protein